MKLLDLNHFQEEEEDGGDEDEEEDGEEEEDIRTHDDDDDEIREEEDDDERRHADQQSRQMDDNCNENNPAEDWSMSEYIQTLCGSQVANPHPHLQALHRVRRERKRRESCTWDYVFFVSSFVVSIPFPFHRSGQQQQISSL